MIKSDNFHSAHEVMSCTRLEPMRNALRHSVMILFRENGGNWETRSWAARYETPASSQLLENWK